MAPDVASAFEEPPGLLVDSPWPHPSAPRWRRRLFHAFHSPAHHAALLAVILLTICLNLAALMVSLFFCVELHEQRAPDVSARCAGCAGRRWRCFFSSWPRLRCAAQL
jgi:hypothetical protein